MTAPPPLLLWVGPLHGGKTTAAAALTDLLRRRGRRVAGLLAPAVWRGNRRAGYDAVDLLTGRRAELLRLAPPGRRPDVGPYVLLAEGLRLGAAALSPEAVAGAELVILDEFGRLELDGRGWRGAADRLVVAAAAPLMLVVRKPLAGQVAALYAGSAPQTISVGEADSSRRVLELLGAA